MLVRTYAPRGKTPILKEFVSRDHVSAIGAITPDGHLFLKTYDHAISSFEVIAFLGQLQRQIHGNLLVIWDGAPIHRSKELKAYLSKGAARRIHLERLPGYAPDLNPKEWVWGYMKRVDLANVACDRLAELEKLIHCSKRRLQRNRPLVESFVKHVGYQFT
jgi:transposase